MVGFVCEEVVLRLTLCFHVFLRGHRGVGLCVCGDNPALVVTHMTLGGVFPFKRYILNYFKEGAHNLCPCKNDRISIIFLPAGCNASIANTPSAVPIWR